MLLAPSRLQLKGAARCRARPDLVLRMSANASNPYSRARRSLYLQQSRRPDTAPQVDRTWKPSSTIIFQQQSSTAMPMDNSMPTQNSINTISKPEHALSARNDDAVESIDLRTEAPQTPMTSKTDVDDVSLPDTMFSTPRGYHIPRSKYLEALNSSPDDPTAYWQHSLFHGPSGPSQKVKLHYCKDKDRSEKVAQLFLHETVIGFDIEWMAQARQTDGITNNVSLIQLASEERIALFHLASFPSVKTVEDLAIPTLKTIMESPEITKVGVAIKGDCTRLRNFLNINCRGTFELSYLHKLILYCSGSIDKVDRRFVRLADQVQEHFGLPLLKGEVQVSDWTKDLEYRQTQYAATDAYANLILYHTMEAKRKALEPMPPRPAHAELNLEISLGEQARNRVAAEILEECEDAGELELASESDISTEELAKDFFHVSLASDPVCEQGLRTPAKRSNNRSKALRSTKSDGKSLASDDSRNAESCTSPAPPRSDGYADELEKANKYADALRCSGYRNLSAQALRAYSLWHEQELDIPIVASILRTPPIQNRTVVTYIIDILPQLPGHLRCPPGKVLDIVTEYRYQPYIKAHRDLIGRVTIEARYEDAAGGVHSTIQKASGIQGSRAPLEHVAFESRLVRRGEA